MLIQFNFKNHKSFYEKSYLDMTATSEKRHIENTININGINLLPFVTIYGPNASGKTTIIDAFYFMAWAIVRTFDSDINKPFYVVPFRFSKKTKNEPSEFEVFVNIGDYEYRYGFVATQAGIKEEWFYKKIFKKGTRAKERMIFERKKNQVIFSKDLSECQKYTSLLNEKSLLLSFLGRKNVNEFAQLYNWFLNISCLGDIPNNALFFQQSIQLLHENKKLYKKVLKELLEIDPCLKGLEIIKTEDKNQMLQYNVYGKHLSIDEKEKFYNLPLEGESAGTKKLIRVLPMIIKSLDEGSLLFIDELDTQVHPLVLKKIVSMYTNKELNKKNAQLIFTTHNTYILNSNDSRRDQIMFVEKDKEGKSKLYSLAEFKKVRYDTDYQKKYFSGSFGSIPFLDN